MNARDIFDICFERFERCRAMQQAVTAINPYASCKGGPPRVGNTLAEYAADFEKCGRRALGDERDRGRLWLFRRYYLENLHYRVVCKELQITEITFDHWSRAVRTKVGAELARAGMFPPRDYFQKRAERLNYMDADE